jgi:hypothetical protein
MPLDLRAEYARSALGDGYWAESAYRLSDLELWHGALRRLQLVARMQQFLPKSNVDEDEFEEYNLPDVSTRQAEFGLNYLLKDGLKATASYGRQFSPDGNANIWTVGIAYRFAFPLGSAQ